jgi:hypothetical protein
MSNKKQTAVEWLLQQFDGEKTPRQWEDVFKKAKAMEKEQMIDFGFDTYCFISGIMNVPFEQLSENRLNAENNYKETYDN